MRWGMSEELKPCPFCEGGGMVDGMITHSNECFIHKLIYQRPAKELEGAWQIRTSDPMLEALAGALEKACNPRERTESWKQYRERHCSTSPSKIPTIKGANMTPTMEDVAGWLREAANKCECGQNLNFSLGWLSIPKVE